MKRLLMAAAAVGFLAATVSANAADKVTIQLKWVADAQFGGYFVAKDKGYYKAAGLDVTIKPGGPDIAPEQVLAAGGADVIVDWMTAALAAREKGVPLVNIAQIFQREGLELTCLKSSGVKSPKDFKGRTLGVWFYGNEYPFYAWMHQLGMPTEGGPNGVKVLKQNFNVDPLLQHQADCISTMTYNEYWQVLDAGIKPSQLVVFKYSDAGVGVLEDGLYANGDKLKDAHYAEIMARFVAASDKGWAEAVKHPDEAAQIALNNDTTGAQNLKHQKDMAREVAKLISDSKNPIGYLNVADYNRTVKELEEQKIITKKPEGAYTHAIWDASKKVKM
ncbi:MAG TPA: ABC transporter substrate-binding protein [Stellaceae bacterium]|jgi:NitT/TauT family transport system substrate-binding protein|nr:ABC transporter substrate-binding protein [Stellaceae bacterium]